jgi:hypothetical protein
MEIILLKLIVGEVANITIEQQDIEEKSSEQYRFLHSFLEKSIRDKLV